MSTMRSNQLSYTSLVHFTVAFEYTTAIADKAIPDLRGAYAKRKVTKIRKSE